MTEKPTETVGEIEGDIDRRRRELSVTLDALQGRVTPWGLADEAGRAMADEGVEWAKAALTLARRNPLAAGLIVAGVAWLALGPDQTAGHAPRDRRRGDNAAGRPATGTGMRRTRRRAQDAPSAKAEPLTNRRPERPVQSAPARLTPGPTRR